MPTKKKRVGFIPRQDVMTIIDKLSTEHNLSNSKIISILVEEALSIRGVFNKKNGLVSKPYKSTQSDSINLSDNSAEFNNNDGFTIDTRSENHFNPTKSTNFKEANKDSFDLQTYKKFLLFLKFQEMMDKYDTN